MKKVAVLILAVVTIFLSGCGGEEIDTIAVVVGSAFDKSDIENEILMTVCVLKANGRFGSEGKSDDTYMTVTESAATVAEAQSKTSLSLERRPFFGQNDVIVLSKDVPIHDIIISFYEGYETRGFENVVIVEKNAKDAMSAKNFMSPVGAVGITEALGSKNKNFVKGRRVHDVIAAMNGKSKAMLLPYAKTKDEEFSFESMCILKDYEFAGVLTKEESAGALMITDEYDSGNISVETEEGVIGVEILNCRSDIKYGGDAFLITAYADYALSGCGNVPDDINDCIKNELENYMKSATQKSYETDCDFLGFADKYYKYTGKDDKNSINDFNISAQAVCNLNFEGAVY